MDKFYEVMGYDFQLGADHILRVISFYTDTNDIEGLKEFIEKERERIGLSSTQEV